MEVLAEWPGTIVEITVAVGDSVSEGDQLLTIEAMKMETPIESPATGRVVAIHVALQDVVEEGSRLISLE